MAPTGGNTTDFTQAALLIGAVFAVTQLFKQVTGGVALPPWVTQLVAILIGVGVTYLVAYSTYANSVTVNGVPLDRVNGAALWLIGLLISGGATVLHQVGVRAISNIGQNQTDQSGPQ